MRAGFLSILGKESLFSYFPCWGPFTAAQLEKKRGPFYGPLLTRDIVLPAPSAAATRIALARFVDGKVTAAEVFVVQAFDRGVGRLIVHLDETEPSRATGVTVGDERNIVNGTESLKSGAYGVRRCVKRQVAYIQSLG